MLNDPGIRNLVYLPERKAIAVAMGPTGIQLIDVVLAGYRWACDCTCSEHSDALLYPVGIGTLGRRNWSCDLHLERHRRNANSFEMPSLAAKVESFAVFELRYLAGGLRRRDRANLGHPKCFNKSPRVGRTFMAHQGKRGP